MDEYPENQLKMLCCICLSIDRKLFQLCRLTDGVNNFYSLLYYDSEAYREGFFKDTASLYICWECRAVMQRVTIFRQKACAAQKTIACIADGKVDMKTLSTLSQLTYHHKNTYDITITSPCSEHDNDSDNFIDCGITDVIISDEDDDLPLSELHFGEVCRESHIKGGSKFIHGEDSRKEYIIEYKDVNCNKHTKRKKKNINQSNKNTKTDGVKLKQNHNGNNYIENEVNIGEETEERNMKKVGKTEMLSKKKKTKIRESKTTNCFNTIIMSTLELQDIRERKKNDVKFVDAMAKCETCIEVFKSLTELEKHNSDSHVEKPDHSKCHVCLSYIPCKSLQVHKDHHYKRHDCTLCTYVAYSENDIIRHITEHDKVVPKKLLIKTPGSKPQRNATSMDKRTPYGYLCTECDKYFENKNQRWKHIQRHHREGYKCAVCLKRFAFKSNLLRHEQLHKGPPPRTECPMCKKMIRTDLVKVHARIHASRQHYSCSACSKKFVSRASYEHHLKYTQAHAAVDILKYKCSQCDKGYRSRGELRDHVNYQHIGKTQHKCPVCGKALATRRCITRHVRRAHHGVKENARDKICQQCGKAFRDKKGLREHEFIHTGERPLSCEICGRTFRQTASLYTHRKRVHNVFPMKRQVELFETTDSQMINVS